MSRWRSNPPPRRTARPSELLRSGRYEGLTGGRARSRVSAPASLQRVASSGRVVQTAAPERHPSPTPESRVPASERGGGAAARLGRTALGSHSGVKSGSFVTEGRVPSPAADPGPPWRTRGTGSELGPGSPGASCRTRECGEPRSGAASSSGRPAPSRGPRAFTLPTSDQARLPARFKHISKRRKRN